MAAPSPFPNLLPGEDGFGQTRHEGDLLATIQNGGKMKVLKVCVAVLLFSCVFARGSAFAACSNLTVTGIWGFQVGASVGQITSDGKGNITAGSMTTNSQGVVSTTSFTGTYSVATNCTGSVTLSVAGAGTETVNFVLDSGNKNFQIISTNPNTTAAGQAFPEGTVTCGLSGKKATFAQTLLGKINSTEPIAYVSQVILDGKGNVSGKGTFAVNGGFSTASITGTYTEGSNCTGTITMTPAGSTTIHLDFVVVNAGKGLLLLETDTTAAVAGVMLQ